MVEVYNQMKSKLLFTLLIPALLTGCNNSGSTPKPEPEKITTIAVSQNPTKLDYNEGEFFNPSGLALKTTSNKGSFGVVIYGNDNKDDFAFSPSLETALTVESTTVEITYAELKTSIDITVKSTVVETETFTIDFSTVEESNSENPGIFDTKFKSYFVFNNEQYLSSFTHVGFSQVNHADQNINGTETREQAWMLGNQGGAGCIYNMNFAKKLVKIKFVARSHAKIYMVKGVQYISADTNSKLTVGNEQWTLKVPTVEDYEKETREFEINSNQLKLQTPEVEKSRVWIFTAELTFEK